MLAIYSPGLCACSMPTLRPQKKVSAGRHFSEGLSHMLVLFRQERKTTAEP